MDNMKYVKFRFDFTDDTTHPYQILNQLFGSTYPVGVLGVETQNAQGALIKRHLHYHFVTDEKVETIRKRFSRNYPQFKERGRGFYSLTEETDVRDVNHFFRYCVKQQEPITFKYEYTRIPIPEDFDLKMQNILAYEEWSKGKEIMTKKAKESLSRLSVYEKILDIIQKTSPEIFTLRDAKLYVLDYFLENNLPPNKNKIIDIANGVAITQGIISKEQFLDL